MSEYMLNQAEDHLDYLNEVIADLRAEVEELRRENASLMAENDRLEAMHAYD